MNTLNPKPISPTLEFFGCPGLGFGASGLGLTRVKVHGLRVQDLGGQDLGFRV